MSRHRDEIVAMRNALTSVANLVTNLNRDLLTKADLLESFDIWKRNFEEKKVVLSWRKKRPELMPAREAQVIDDCWAIALSKAIGIYLRLRGDNRDPPTPNELLNGVPPECLSARGAIDDLAHVIPYLEAEGFFEEGKTMRIHYRPHVDAPQEHHEKFERCLVRLLANGPVAVGYDIWPTLQTYGGIGVYLPAELELEQVRHEVFTKHDSLLTGVGVQVQDGELVEFWELNDSMGEHFGDDEGYLRFGRHEKIITAAYELEH